MRNIFVRHKQHLAWGYSPEIDGLRAVAILSVFVFHFNNSFLGGGFVGVDIFFVISGYLITSVLLNDMDGKHPSEIILRFYQRRIARIAPVFLVVLLATLAAGALIYSAHDFASLGASSTSAALSVINVKLLFQGNYFRVSPDSQALLHYWSLAVEEQYYLLFPIFLYVIQRFTKRPLIITLAICAASFLASVVITPLSPTAAFYLLPTRAWEMLVGSSLALMRHNGVTVAGRPASFFAWGGAGLLALSCITISENNSFPGWIAVLPVIGSACILASVESAPVGGVFRAAFAHPAAVFIGKRSYSLYLWHWPIFSFVDYQFFATEPVFRTALKLSLCIVATLLSYSFVEQPLRSYFNQRPHRTFAFVSYGLAVLVICIVGWQIRVNNYMNATTWQINAGGIPFNNRGRVSVALIGDSQGAMYGTELVSLSRELEFNLNILSQAGGNELPDEDNTHWPAIHRFISERHPNVIIIAEAWSSKLGNDTRKLHEVLDLVGAYGGQAILLTQQPILPPLASREAIRSGVTPPFFEEPADRATRLRATDAVKGLTNDRVTVIDAAEVMIGHNGAIRLIADNGRLTYGDPTHLTDAGTVLIRPKLKQALLGALAKTNASN